MTDPVQIHPSILPALKQLEASFSDAPVQRKVSYQGKINTAIGSFSFSLSLSTSLPKTVLFDGTPLSELQHQYELDNVLKFFPEFTKAVEKAAKEEEDARNDAPEKIQQLQDLYRLARETFPSQAP